MARGKKRQYNTDLWEQLELFSVDVEVDNGHIGVDNDSGSLGIPGHGESVLQDVSTLNRVDADAGTDLNDELFGATNISDGNVLDGIIYEPGTSAESGLVPGERGRDSEYGEVESGRSSDERDFVRPAIGVIDAPRFPIPLETVVPSGAKSRAIANIEAIRVLRQIQQRDTDDPTDIVFATAEEQEVLAKYSGWGACADIFDQHNASFENLRTELLALLSEEEYAAARRSTLNAHYTDPVIASEMLKALTDLGVPNDAVVLEPGCGTGNFIGLNDTFTFVGVEIDPTSASIAQLLYPDASIINADFRHKVGGNFSASIGNVPFGNFTVVDPLFNPNNHSIHNYFIVKSLRLLHPGGIGMFITSSFTLDSMNPSARVEMARYGEFLGAVRLPTQAHARVAGTTVLTDIVMFRRREEMLSIEEAQSQEWVKTVPVAKELRLNMFLSEHPDMILGELEVDSGQFGPTHKVTLDPSESLDSVLRKSLGTLTNRAVEAGTTYYRPLGTTETVSQDDSQEDIRYRVGSIYERSDGTFSLFTARGLEPFSLRSAKDAKELRQLIKLRDAYDSLLNEESSVLGEGADRYREILNRVYDSYVAEFGYLNRFTTRPKKKTAPSINPSLFIANTNEDLGVETGDLTTDDVDDPEDTEVTRVYPPLGGFRKDKMYRAVMSLENFDDSSGIGKKAAIFSKPILDTRTEILGHFDVGTSISIAAEADTGIVDLAYASRLLGVSSDEISELAFDHVYLDPTSRNWIVADAYLSGNVKEKYQQAVEAAKSDPNFERNVEALKIVKPRDLDISEISLRLGAPYISADVVTQAFNSLFAERDHVVITSAPVVSAWRVMSAKSGYKGLEITNTYGVPGHLTAHQILERLLNSSTIVIRVKIDDKTWVTDENLTQLARDKADALSDRIIERILTDPTLAETVAEEYNRMFNSHVPRKYDGSHLTFPGLASSFETHAHQKRAIHRALATPVALFAHPVGAGKTAELLIAGSLLKQSKKISKPLYTVPGHVVEQFARESLQLYPKAKLLVADASESTPSSRAEFVAKCASEDWDFIVMSHDFFTLLPVPEKFTRRFLRQQTSELRLYLEDLDKLAGREKNNRKKETVKSIEKRVAQRIGQLEAQIEKLSQRKDDVITFDRLGVDCLFVDEMHMFKNLSMDSNQAGMSIGGSQRAMDLLMKIRYLQEQAKTPTTPIVYGATATPIANKMTEAYVLAYYLDPKGLEDRGIFSLDQFLAAFSISAQVMEIAPTGVGYRSVNKIAKFTNLPELDSVFTFMDYIPPSQLGIKVPKIEGGKASVTVIENDPSAHHYMMLLADRAEEIAGGRVNPKDDNMLKITTDARKAALDLGLVGRRYDDDKHAKSYVMAKAIFERWTATKDNQYLDESGELSSRKGALQLVFCDMSTPKGDGRWNFYDELKANLAYLGIPAKSIRFIHEANTHEERHRLFKDARSGEIAVLMGSTSKLGTGANIQTRVVAVHHADITHRPDEMTQRNGRGIRQGNQNEEVAICLYLNERSYEARMAHRLGEKTSFIEQILDPNKNAREVEDEAEHAISYEEVKALATGNPMYLRMAELKGEITRLTRQYEVFRANVTRSQNGSKFEQGKIDDAESKLELVEPLLPVAAHVASLFKKTTSPTRPTPTSKAERLFANTDETDVPQSSSEVYNWAFCMSAHDRRIRNEHSTTLGEFNALIANEITHSYMSFSIIFEGMPILFAREHNDGTTNIRMVLNPLESWEILPLDAPMHKFELRTLEKTSGLFGRWVKNLAERVPVYVSEIRRNKATAEERLSYYNLALEETTFPKLGYLDGLKDELAYIETTLSKETFTDEIAKIRNSDDPWLIDDSSQDPDFSDTQTLNSDNVAENLPLSNTEDIAATRSPNVQSDQDFSDSCNDENADEELGLSDGDGSTLVRRRKFHP